MSCRPGCRCARCYVPCFDPCPGGWSNFRSGACCAPILFDAFLGGRSYPIGPRLVQVRVAAQNGSPFASSPNPLIGNQAALLVWLNGVLVEAANLGFSTFGSFQAVGGYLLAARIGGTCVTGLTPILT